MSTKKDSDGSWWVVPAAMLAVASPLIAITIGGVIERSAEANAKRDVIVACYNAGNKDCQNLWDKEIGE